MYQENLSIASRYFILHMERKEGGRERERKKEREREVGTSERGEREKMI